MVSSIGFTSFLGVGYGSQSRLVSLTKTIITPFLQSSFFRATPKGTPRGQPLFLFWKWSGRELRKYICFYKVLLKNQSFLSEMNSLIMLSVASI